MLTETISTHKSLCAKEDWLYQTGYALCSCVTDTEKNNSQCASKKTFPSTKYPPKQQVEETQTVLFGLLYNLEDFPESQSL